MTHAWYDAPIASWNIRRNVATGFDGDHRGEKVTSEATKTNSVPVERP
jgi:hypothetical protein